MLALLALAGGEHEGREMGENGEGDDRGYDEKE